MRRSWGGGTGGQLLVAKLVTSPDSARATEPRRPEATLELRRGARGARFGRGAGERERVRVRGEEALSDAERNREAATSRLGEGAGADTAGTAGAAGTRGEPVTGGTAPRPGLAGPMTLERPTAMVSSSAASTESWAASWRRSSPRDMEEAESTIRQMERAKMRCEPRAMKAASAESKKGAETQPLGLQSWQASMSSLSKSAEQTCEH